MKFIKFVHPKSLFRTKKSDDRHISKSAPASFNTVSSDSNSSSSSSSDPSYTVGGKSRRSATPTSVLLPSARPRYQEIEIGKSGDWSDVSASGASIGKGDGDFCSDLVEAFKLIDRDGDGKITKSELETLLSQIGAAPPSEEELATMLAEIDRDGDGCISLEEFGAISSAFGPASGTEELQETFEVFDADHDGRISAEELLRVLSAIGDERCTLDDCRRMIGSVAVNGDGFVCFEAFRRMMVQQPVK